MAVFQIKYEASYSKHDVKANKAVNVEFKMPYSELPHYIQATALLNENVTVGVKIGSDKKPMRLGTFMINGVNVGRDGDGTIKLNSQTDAVELDNLNILVERCSEPIHLFLKANIEESDEEEDDEIEEE